MMEKFGCLPLAMTLILFSAASSSATPVTYVEVGDAGQTLGTAPNVGGGVNAITGLLENGTAVDLFALNLGAGVFTASTGNVPCCDGSTDTQLFLFDASGMGIIGNDDAPTGNTQKSFIQSNLTGGLYYLAVSTYDLDPFSAGGFIFAPDPSVCCNQPMVAPTGPGGGSPLLQWAVGPSASGSGQQPGPYTITLNQETISAVPEPATLILVGTGITAVLRRRKKARKLASASPV
jgi:hypothetical protein